MSSTVTTQQRRQYTPGPWRWEFNADHKSVHLVGGMPLFDLTVMDFSRWGMGRAVPRFRDTAEDGFNLMDRLCDRPDWIAPEPGREHHKRWHQMVAHPDARLMAAAPDLLEALEGVVVLFTPYASDSTQNYWLDRANAAINTAKGGAA